MIWKGDFVMKTDKTTIIRTVILFVSLLNIILEMFGVKTLPIDNEMVTDAVSVILLVASTIAAWWKNNSFTKPAVTADEYLKELKGKK